VVQSRRALGLLLCTLWVSLSIAGPQDNHEAVDHESSTPLIRGGIVFKNYCVLCHGERGDGVSRAAKLYVGVNLAIKPASSPYYEKIIREGGEAVGVSPSMPPWRNELSNEQIGDALAFLAVLGDPAKRGEVVFKTNCVLCHGLRGDGKGRAAKLFNPPPADLTASILADKYKERIIRFGGGSVGRSSSMPAWEERLTKIEVADLLAYLRTIVVAKNEP
jgi:cytochrome c oxidase cbb3-type subunit III